MIRFQLASYLRKNSPNSCFWSTNTQHTSTVKSCSRYDLLVLIYVQCRTVFGAGDIANFDKWYDIFLLSARMRTKCRNMIDILMREYDRYLSPNLCNKWRSKGLEPRYAIGYFSVHHLAYVGAYKRPQRIGVTGRASLHTKISCPNQKYFSSPSLTLSVIVVRECAI